MDIYEVTVGQIQEVCAREVDTLMRGTGSWMVSQQILTHEQTADDFYEFTTQRRWIKDHNLVTNINLSFQYEALPKIDKSGHIVTD